MNYSLILGIIACALLANVASAPVDCDGTLPAEICEHLNNLETRIANLAKKSIVMVSKSVQESASKNAQLFAKTMELVNATKPKRPMNASHLAKIMEELNQAFKNAEDARDEALADAVKSIQEASLRIGSLIEKIIADAADGDHSDAEELKRRLKGAVTSAHQKIKAVTFQAISKVHRGNAKVENLVVRILKKLGHSEASSVLSFVEVISTQEDMKIADDAEQEIEADFDAAANEAYELIILADSKAKRGIFQDWWNKIKAKLTSLATLIMDEVKKAIAIMWPQIKEKLTEIVQIILNTAKQAIVNIAGEIILVTLPPS